VYLLLFFELGKVYNRLLGTTGLRNDLLCVARICRQGHEPRCLDRDAEGIDWAKNGKSVFSQCSLPGSVIFVLIYFFSFSFEKPPKTTEIPLRIILQLAAQKCISKR